MKKNKINKPIFLLLIIAIITGSGYLFWQSQLLAKSSQGVEKEFSINQGEPASRIAENLEKEELIRNAAAFRLYLITTGYSRKIQAGLFKLSSSQSAKEIAKNLTFGAYDVWVTIPEGYRIEEIADRLEKQLKIERSEFLNYAQEGYMFPDTYLIPKDFTAQETAALMRQNFNKQFNQNFKTDLTKINLTEKDLVILASLVEREAKLAKDRPVVAGILINRYRNNIPLQVDATVQYAIGKRKNSDTYWPQINASDLSFNSLYNTYLNASLPPGPIANPGIESIKSVIYYNESDFLFYLTDNKGQMHYAKTLEEHNQNIKNFL